MLAAWPYHNMVTGVMRGFSSAQATPDASVFNWIESQNNCQATSIECAEQEGGGLALGESYHQDPDG